MLYKLGGANLHYEPAIGYIKYQYVLASDEAVDGYLSSGWGLNLLKLHLDSLSVDVDKKTKSKKVEAVATISSDDLL